jgi:hypothetical protein
MKWSTTGEASVNHVKAAYHNKSYEIAQTVELVCSCCEDNDNDSRHKNAEDAIEEKMP